MILDIILALMLRRSRFQTLALVGDPKTASTKGSYVSGLRPETMVCRIIVFISSLRPAPVSDSSFSRIPHFPMRVEVSGKGQY